MNEGVKKDWIDALISGEFPQSTNRLQNLVEHTIAVEIAKL